MFRRLLVIPTLVSLLLHGAFGCHWHHQACAAQSASAGCCGHHQEALSRGEHQQCATECCDDSPRHEEHHDNECPCDHEESDHSHGELPPETPEGDEQHDEAPTKKQQENKENDHPHKPCTEGSCVFVVPQKVKSPSIKLDVSFDVVTAELVASTAKTVACLGLTQSHFASFFGCPLPVRAHVVKQLWLI